MAEDWLDKALRDFQDTITCGLYKGLRSLGPSDLDRVMEAQARACVLEYVKLFQIPSDLSLEDFLDRMRFGGSSKIEIRRQGNVIYWD